MGRQGSSPPCQRHRLPHYRRRRHDHHNHSNHQLDPHATSSDRAPLSLGKLNRTSHPPNSHALVESWLGQIASTSRLIFPGSQYHPINIEEQQHSREGDLSGYHRERGHENKSWRPQHILPVQDRSSPSLPLTKDYERNPKRVKRESHDSSIIDDYDLPRQKWGRGTEEVSYEYEGRLRCRSPYESPVDNTDASPRAPDAGKILAFEKRPRHKTRADKYEREKLARDSKKKNPPEEGKRARKSRSKKKKDIAIGKNVMNNFTSEAVTNDRITVCAHGEPSTAPLVLMEQ